ncbi:hypothetical protein DEO48_25990 [Enterobacter sp. CGMCC 5087]|uniref:hypothetical protein n=1 Tax=Enterobacter sp. CGMCC 5087 TaxID=2183878 RepID=UPI000D676401|nr:hypothetical protein [Enterobacter sp. CGMCC 5087]PWI77138.1 hypothetical protein DEO48_25990 [Enterobacter sp. CGMCC 5087]
MIHAKEDQEDDGPNSSWTEPYDPAKDNKLSFSYWAYPIQKDKREQGSLSPYGVAFWPAGKLRTDGSAYEENFTCGFPRDGGTGQTLGVNQCGLVKKKSCQSEGISTADDYIASKRNCGFSLNNPNNDDTLSAFSTILEVEKIKLNTSQNALYSMDEFLLKPWTGTDLSKIPLMAFFINMVRETSDSGKRLIEYIDGARKLQLDFYKKSGIFAPIVVIFGDPHNNDWSHLIFSSGEEYQSPEIPQYVHVFTGTNNDYSSFAFARHR